MALRNVALIKDGKVKNVIVVEDDPAQWPGYVRACNPDVTDAYAHLTAEHDAVVELHDGEMCEPGALVKDTKIKTARQGEKLGVVRVKESERGIKPAVERFERAVAMVDAQVDAVKP